MPETSAITVLVVDDQPLAREGNALALDSAPGIRVIGEAADGREAIEQATRLDPDIILMDVRMPGMDGIHATRGIVDGGLRSRVIVLTTFDLDEYAFGALRAGASAFLVKTATHQELVDAVRVVARGDAIVTPRITRQLIDSYTGRDQSAPGAQCLSVLSPPRTRRVQRDRTRPLERRDQPGIASLTRNGENAHQPDIRQTRRPRSRTGCDSRSPARVDHRWPSELMRERGGAEP